MTDSRTRTCPACHRTFRTTTHLGRPPRYCKRLSCRRNRWTHHSRVYRLRIRKRTNPGRRPKSHGVVKSRQK